MCHESKQGTIGSVCTWVGWAGWQLDDGGVSPGGLFDLFGCRAVHSGLSPRYTPHTHAHTSCHYVTKTVAHNMRLSSRRQESCS